MDWAQILVYVLAALFLVFLIVAIVLTVLLVSITRQIKAATASAERAVKTLEESASKFNKAALPLMLTKSLAGRLMKAANRRGSRRDP